MKQRKFKFSLGIKIASILSCLALVSIGFASWWIVQINNEDGTQVGSFTVYKVEEKNVTITVDEDNGWTGETIIFGQPENPEVNATWLIADSVGTESLSATLTFNVKTDDTSVMLNQLVGSVKVTFDLSTDEVTIPANTPGFENQNQHTMTFADLFKYAMGQGYIAAPKISGNYGTNGTIAEVTYDGTNAVTVEIKDLNVQSMDVTINFEFGWGSMTNKNGENQNPYDYFNGQTYGTEIKDKALAMLTAIKLLGGVENAYTVTIDATVKSN